MATEDEHDNPFVSSDDDEKVHEPIDDPQAFVDRWLLGGSLPDVPMIQQHTFVNYVMAPEGSIQISTTIVFTPNVKKEK